MTTQITLDFTPIIHGKENNLFSQRILEDNEDHFSNQCRIVYEALKRGERLTTGNALTKYGIGDLRRRIKDLRDMHHIPIRTELLQNRFKEYFL